MSVTSSLSPWLQQLRRAEIANVVVSDPRSRDGSRLGVSFDVARREVVGGGQADFDEEWRGHGVTLSGSDRALLYGFCNLSGHLLELTHALRMLLRRAEGFRDPVVLDLGCGPCTGGLALADVLELDAAFTYVGVDRAASMRALGEQLATKAQAFGRMCNVQRKWATSVETVKWTDPQSWRPVLVIVSYLLASPTLDVVALMNSVMPLVSRISRGRVVILYTNSAWEGHNLQFPLFRETVQSHGFELVIDDERGEIPVFGSDARSVRYALFSRGSQQILELGGDK